MSELTPRRPSQASGRIAIGVAIIALIVAVFSIRRGSDTPTDGAVGDLSSFEKAMSDRTLRVGIGAFPPYTMIDAGADDPRERYTGFSIDMVYRIAESFDPPWNVEFKEVNWDTLRADMYSGEFDFLANIMYRTIPRLTDFDFTSPYTYMSIGIGVVLIDDERFEDFEDLNNPDVRISLVSGWTPTELALARLPRANHQIRPMDAPAAQQYQELKSGRADIVLQDAATAFLIKQNHPDEVKLLWVDDPPMRVAAGFMLRHGDDDYRHFLSAAIESMIVDGTISELDKKWNSLTDIRVDTFRPGSGITGGSKGSD